MKKFLSTCLKFGAILDVLVILWIIAPCIKAAEFSVPDDFISIQAAIDAVDDGDVIIVSPGIYYENIIFKGKEITLRSKNGPDTTIIDGEAKVSVVAFDHLEGPDSVLEGVTIQNGASITGGGIHCSNFSIPIIRNCLIRKNSESGIYCSDNSSLTIIGCWISENISNAGGGGTHRKLGTGTHFYSYSELLEDVAEMITPLIKKGRTHSFHLYVIRAKNRCGLMKYLVDHGIATGLHYPIPLHLQKAYAHLGYQGGDFPVAERTAEEILSLPMYPELTEQQIHFVVSQIKNFYAGGE